METTKPKIAETYEDAWNMQHRFEGPAGAWIQWKGTEVCMDVSCKCGYHGHVDASFTYVLQCPQCDALFMLNGHIEMIEIKDAKGMSTVLMD